MLKRLILVCGLLLSMGLIAKTKTKKIVLTKDNTVAFFGEVNPTIISEVLENIKKLDTNLKSGYPIYLVLNTPGGQIEAGMRFISFLNSLNRPVHTITLFAASMGFQFVQNLGKRYIIEYGTLMSHKASGGFSGEFGTGGSQLDSRYTLWLRRLIRLDQQTVLRTNGKQTLKSYRSAYENELWLNGWEAVDQGYADALANISCDVTLKGTRKVHIKNTQFEGVVVFDACPLITDALNVLVNIKTNKGTMTNEEFINKGGKFGVKCKNNSKTQALCANDQHLTIKKIENIKEFFKKMFINIKGQVNKNKIKLEL